jgi:hypothetical protein
MLAEPTVTHELVVMDRTGDTKIVWDSGNADDVAAAKDTYDKLKKKGYMAYTVKRNGDKGEVIHDFDAEAEKIILAPRMVGG